MDLRHPDWDADRPELRHNLAAALADLEHQASSREPPTLDMARRWQRRFMQNLHFPVPSDVGESTAR